ncbi:MAG TPA: zinc ABC transporter substrate-binding protein [Dehalococcoidia bacterium]
MRKPLPGRVSFWLVGAGVTAIVVGACGGASPNASTRLQVVAAENFWGSIARQIGGDHVQVTTIISNPDADPHDYEPNAKDSRAIATAKYVIVNGAGYDDWSDKLQAANPAPGRKTLKVASIGSRSPGDNPHMWYSPAIVFKVVDAIASDLEALDPANAAYYDQQAAKFKSADLARYNDLRAMIKQRYGGTAIGSTESIFDDLASDLGLDDITPPAFEKSISEGEDVSPQDLKTVETQIGSGQIKVLVYNKQNATQAVRNLVARAKAAGIPVVEITETLEPQNATFQDWQAGQLSMLQTALMRAVGR